METGSQHKDIVDLFALAEESIEDEKTDDEILRLEAEEQRQMQASSREREIADFIAERKETVLQDPATSKFVVRRA